MMEKETQLKNLYLKLKGGIFEFKGSSMEPTLMEGCRLKIEPSTTNDIKPGDIVVFGREVLICHRVLSRVKVFNKIYFLEMGDNTDRPNVISEDEIIGKVVSVIEGEKVIGADSYAVKRNILFYPLGFISFSLIFTAYFLKRLDFLRENLILRKLGALIWRQIGRFWIFLMNRQMEQ
ncbi:MAG: S26 family signal peptidase [Candidatus Omnitrophica bacterium]|nr:S26 family signal peptidase [Candidatus Omnitrophota bacterium]MBU4590659.1 S26 family signal peptidase [Candidatus Omnitrophota bacterium]